MHAVEPLNPRRNGAPRTKDRKPSSATGVPKPWEEPGHKFFTDECRAWLGGYVTVTEQERIVGPSDLEKSLACQRGREASKLAGKGWGNGTIPGGLGRDQPAIDRNEKIRRGEL